jgi:ureidoglycolate dehydrogenase (NAD+)
MARVDAGQLKGFIHRILSAAELCEANARIVADSITTAELFGFHSHGVIRIPHYIKRLRIGSLNGNPDIRVVQQKGNTAIVSILRCVVSSKRKDINRNGEEFSSPQTEQSCPND